MIEREKEGIRWLEFELLMEAPIIHACLLRHGGVSESPFDALNLSVTTGDVQNNVYENRARIKKALGLPDLCFGKLDHGVNIVPLESHSEDKGMFACNACYDGLSTNRSGHTLIMTQADCQGAIFYDPINKALATIHCGWRGNVQNIYKHTVDHMKSHYGSRPENLLVCISPSLGPEHSEFVNYKEELPEALWAFQFKPNYFDLWEISRWQLEEAGVLNGHIQIAEIDTFSQEKDFFSYRRNRVTGRQATLCALKGKRT